MKRREFLKTTIAASALAGLNTPSLSQAADASAGGREFYELRVYHLKNGAGHALLDSYLEKAAIPAWNRLGAKNVGVFVQQERTGSATGTEVRDPDAVWVLIPHSSLSAFAEATNQLAADAEIQKAGADYLQTPKDHQAFERIDSWLMLAFAGMPRLELAAYSREKKPRMFELRTYESHSEVKALKKVEMFNSGEIETMRQVGLAPVFYGQALIGKNLPHLTYMVSAVNETEHKKHWDDFGKHPVWDKLKNDPQYADTVSKISNWFLAPTSYSQI
jgi:hypothetical protein